jgi:hypothetical protein
MSELAREFYASASLMALPMASLVFFTIAFGAAITFAIRARKSDIQRLASMPLEGDRHE